MIFIFPRNLKYPMLDGKKILIVGTGSTGSELLKLLNFYKTDLTILDYDTVMVTDLNRQFYFTEKDRQEKEGVGEPCYNLMLRDNSLPITVGWVSDSIYEQSTIVSK